MTLDQKKKNSLHAQSARGEASIYMVLIKRFYIKAYI